MMIKPLLIYLFIFYASGLIWAQDSAIKINFCVNSPKGVYIQLLNQQDFETADSNYVKNIRFFTIQRLLINSKEPNPKKLKNIAMVMPVQNMNELLKILTRDNIEELKKTFDYKTEEDVLNFFNKIYSPNHYGPYYQLLQTKLAAGHAYFDETAEEGKLYQYIVTVVSNNNSEKTWSTCRVDRTIYNPVLTFFKPISSKTVTYDSAIIYSWFLLVKNSGAENFIKNFVKNNPKITASNFIGFPIQVVQGNAFASVNGNFQKMQNLIPQLNPTQDTLFFSYEIRTIPKNIHSCYLQLKDPAGNIGLHSDTQTAIALSKKTIPLVYAIQSEDVVDGIRLTWKKMPIEPFIMGVHIVRTNSNSHKDTIGFFGMNDTVFIDYKIDVGQTYQYNASAIYHEMVKLKQDLPAQAIGQYTKFTAPNKPTNFKAKNEGKHIELSWEYQQQKSFFGFYVYRGISENKLTVIAGPIKTTRYLDTSVSLSGRCKYFYSVLTQNLRQDTSLLCNTIAIMPNRPIEMTNAIDVKFYYANGKLYLNWNDVRQIDNAIENYVIQKKFFNKPKFQYISKTLISETTYIDSIFNAGDTVLYKIAPVSFRGDTGKFGNESQFILPLPIVDIVNNFRIQNQENGVEIILERSRKTTWKSYNIYRREEKETTFKKIASIPSDQFNYRDKTVTSGKKYVYAITIEVGNNREGSRGESRSTLYKPVKITSE